MNVELVRTVLLWSAGINYAILLVWFLAFVLGHDTIHRLHGRWFQLSREQFDAIHYGSISFYKLIILVFNLVPGIVLGVVA